jgi:hypothetical protein
MWESLAPSIEDSTYRLPNASCTLGNLISAIIQGIDNHQGKGKELSKDGDGSPAHEKGLGEDVVTIKGHGPEDKRDEHNKHKNVPGDAMPAMPAMQLVERILVERMADIIQTDACRRRLGGEPGPGSRRLF